MTVHTIIRETLDTKLRSQMFDLTDRVQRAVQQKQILDGFVIVYSPHTTAGVTIQENADPDVQQDVLEKLQRMIPQGESYYQHAEGNSDSHVKTSLVGNSITVMIESGKLVLGRWQAIYFMEFDGPRERKVMIKLIELRGPSQP
jgi:secondary thiamine-phosphate synthase enzyme